MQTWEEMLAEGRAKTLKLHEHVARHRVSIARRRYLEESEPERVFTCDDGEVS